MEDKSVLVLDLSNGFNEQADNDLVLPIGDEEGKKPGLYDVIRLLHHAKTDRGDNIKFIMMKKNIKGPSESDQC